MNDPLAPRRGDVAPEARPAQSGSRGASGQSRQDVSPKGNKRETVERCLHVLALASLTVAQPLLDLLARHGEFFVAHRFTRAGVGWLVFSLLVLIPLPAVVLELLAAKAPRRLGDAVHGLIVAGLAALFLLLTLKRLGLPAAPALALAAGAGALFATVYLRARGLRFFVTALALSIVAVPAAFLASPQVRKIISTRRASALELPAVASSAPIVFIIFDELPTAVLLDEAGEINRHRYPNLARLAETSSWFPNAVSVAEVSESAIPAILTGTYPEPDHLPTVGDYPRNLFTLFGGAYDVWAREPMTELCPPELNLRAEETTRRGRLRAVVSDLTVVYRHLVVPVPWDARLPPIDAAWRDFAALGEPAAGRTAKPPKKSFFARAIEATHSDRRQELASLAAAIGQGSGPSLYFLHVLLPHRPWEFTPEGHRYPRSRSTPGLRNGTWLRNGFLIQQAYQRLIAQVQFLDAEIGRIVRRLEETDLFDRSLIVLVGDHGAGFSPGDSWRLLSATNAHEIMPVPLLIKHPGQRQARRIEHPVGTVDVLPTVLDALGIESPWELEGRSGFDPRPRKLRFVTKQRGTRDVNPAVHREKYATMRWKLKTFGDGSDPLDLFRSGPDGDFFGRPTGGLVDRGGSRFTAAIDNLKLFENVDPGDGTPFLVTGYVDGHETESCCRLAVALNGTVYGATRTHRDTGTQRNFSVLLPQEAFRPGANRVDVYELLDAAGEVRRLPLRAAEERPEMPS